MYFPQCDLNGKNQHETSKYCGHCAAHAILLAPKMIMELKTILNLGTATKFGCFKTKERFFIYIRMAFTVGFRWKKL